MPLGASTLYAAEDHTLAITIRRWSHGVTPGTVPNTGPGANALYFATARAGPILE